MSLPTLLDYRKKVPGKCVICKETFPPSYTNRKYCSPQCKGAARYKRDKRAGKLPRTRKSPMPGLLGQLAKTPEELPAAIRKMRADMELSRYRFSRFVGVTEKAVWQWEHGQRIPNVENRENIAIIYARWMRDHHDESTGTD